MFAKRFFFVCAGLLALAATYHLGASIAVAKPAGALGDVAVLTGVLNDGETIPLPTYSDGTTAIESDCRWTVSMNRDDNLDMPELEVCSTEGRVVRASSCPTLSGSCTSPRPGKANYLIIAVRRS